MATSKQRSTAVPKWVKRLGVAVILLVAAFVAIHIAGGGLAAHRGPVDAEKHT